MTVSVTILNRESSMSQMYEEASLLATPELVSLILSIVLKIVTYFANKQ